MQNISTYSDEELKTAIEGLIKTYTAGMTIINYEKDGKKTLDDLTQNINLPQMKNTAKQKIQSSMPYFNSLIVEATIRGFDYSKELQGLYGRKTAAVNIALFLV